MKIKQIQAIHIQIPLKVRFSQSNNTAKFSDSIILQLTTQKGYNGFGEACPRLYVTGEDWKSIYKDLQKVDKLIKDQEFDSVEMIRTFVLGELYPKIDMASLCAIELALLDAFGKEAGVSILDHFGENTIPAFQYSGVVPLMPIKKLQLFINMQLSKFNLRALKLKVGAHLEDSLEKIDLIQSELGKETELRVDANCSWNYEDAEEQIPAFLDKGINSFEQIFPKGNENDMGRICKTFGKEARIMADESCTSFESAKYLIENGLCNFFNFKISKNGGIFNALRIYKYITESGAGGQLGAHFGETSILTLAGVLFASKAPGLSNFEGALGTYLLEADICHPSLKIDQNGFINASLSSLGNTGFGLGVDPDQLFKYSI